LLTRRGKFRFRKGNFMASSATISFWRKTLRRVIHHRQLQGLGVIDLLRLYSKCWSFRLFLGFQISPVLLFTLWHNGWKPEYRSQKRRPLLTNGRWTRARINTHAGHRKATARLSRHATIEELLEAMFHMPSVSRLYSEDERDNAPDLYSGDAGFESPPELGYSDWGFGSVSRPFQISAGYYLD
jgi:hypothetical protein